MTTFVPPSREAETAARRVEREIRKAIVTLEIFPGSPLSEKDIADRYGVSRQPVREAFIALARAGLVEIHPRRGTFVVMIDADMMRQARFVRESIEVAVVRRACVTFDPAVRRRIENILEAQMLHVGNDAHYLFQREDENFHASLAEGAGFPTAWTVIEDIKAHMDRVCHLTLPLPETRPHLVAQHRAIVDAIDAHDADAAAHAVRQHLEEILQALPTVQQMHAYLFT